LTLTTESKRGSNLSGTDGTSGRGLTLSNTQLTQAGGFQVFVNGLLLVLATEYTVAHNNSASTLVFLNPVWDSDYIIVNYLQAGGTSLTASYITSSDVYNRTGLSTTEVIASVVDELILDAESELEMITGRKFTNANAITEYLSTNDKDVIGNYQTTVILNHYPVQSITEFKLLDSDGNATATFDTLTSVEISAGTVDSDDYWLQTVNDATTNQMMPTGKIILKTDTISKGTNNVKVAYTYGYSTVPRPIMNLAVCLAGLRVWMYFLGGNYNNVNNYSLSEFSVNNGDLYTRGMQNIKMLNDQAEVLMQRIGRKSKVLFFATGS
jgi:hypothetical protein